MSLHQASHQQVARESSTLTKSNVMNRVRYAVELGRTLMESKANSRSLQDILLVRYATKVTHMGADKLQSEFPLGAIEISGSAICNKS
jgi:DUF917 family protein